MAEKAWNAVRNFMKRISFVLCGIALVAGSVALVSLLKERVSFATPPEIGIAKVEGKQDAPIQMIEYSDYECTACAQVQPLLKETMKAYPGRLSLVFRHFPIQSHKISPLAHQSAECAGEQGAFWPYHELLYEYQDIWMKAADPKDEFLNIARDCDLDLEKFLTCLGNPFVTEKIRRDYLSGQALKIKSTPTIYIGNRMFVGKKQLEQEGLPYIHEVLGKGAAGNKK